MQALENSRLKKRDIDEVVLVGMRIYGPHTSTPTKSKKPLRKLPAVLVLLPFLVTSVHHTGP
jgi:hypothetical protein